MTSFPGSPKVLKGAIVGIDIFNPISSVAIFQYNPEQLSRSLDPQYSEAGGGQAEAAAVRRALSHELQTLLADADAGALAGAGERARMRLNIGTAGDTAALARGTARAVSGALGIPARRGRP